jgi:hypothetical protein
MQHLEAQAVDGDDDDDMGAELDEDAVSWDRVRKVRFQDNEMDAGDDDRAALARGLMKVRLCDNLLASLFYADVLAISSASHLIILLGSRGV